MHVKTPDDNISFLAGGGEMAELMRNYDWSTTIIGLPTQWPQSLRTTLSIILNSKFPMFLFWGKDLLCFYNDAYRPSLGNNGKHPAALGKPGAEIWPEIWHIIKPLIDHVIAGGDASWSEDQLVPIYRNGAMEDVYWTFSFSPVSDESGCTTGVFVTCTETTKQVIAKRDLLEIKNQLQFHIDATELATFDYNFITTKYFVNQRAREWFGFSDTNEIGLDDIINVIVPKDRQRVLDTINRALDNHANGNINIEYLIIDAITGTERFMKAKGKAWFNDNNILYRLNGTVQDVTDQTIARQKIEESEKRFRIMAEGSAIMIAMADETSNATYFNKAWTDLTGRTAEELLNYGWVDLVHPDDKQQYLDIFLNALKKQIFFTGEMRILNKLGTYTWLVANGPPIFRPDGSFAGYICSCTDITERKLFEQNLERQVQERTKELQYKNEDLERMNIELQSFANVSSHDLQEPLRKIQIFADRIFDTEMENISDKAKEYFAKMRNAASRMQTLVEDLLAYSRTNKTERIFVNSDLKEIIQDVQEELKEVLEAKKATIVLHDFCQAQIIPFQFRQLFYNLISNSIKFSNINIAPVIEISCKIENNLKLPLHNIAHKSYCHITVSDNGIGFEEEYSEKIFELFQRLHTKKEYKGTGIGLAIVKKIVDNHNGIIIASSQINKGATFDIYIPVIEIK